MESSLQRIAACALLLAALPFPDVPALIESGYPGFVAAEWFVVLGPAGVPKDIVAKLNAEIDRAMKLPDVQVH
jgi:tripartite-type tricarboxylate transporter receptor subunit TctC